MCVCLYKLKNDVIRFSIYMMNITIFFGAFFSLALFDLFLGLASKIHEQRDRCFDSQILAVWARGVGLTCSAVVKSNKKYT